MSAARQPAGGKAARAASGEGRRRIWASRRLAELYRLAQHRREYGVAIDEAPWACALAATLQAASRGPYRVRKGAVSTWRGLDVQELAEAMRKSGFPALGLVDLAGEAGDCLRLVIDRIERAKRSARHREARGDKLGRWIRLTSEERIFCRITSMLAIDETEDERKARNAETKRERDRNRQRAQRARKHISREQYEAGSLGKSKPWEAEGVSRATYFRRSRKAGIAANAGGANTATDQSHASRERKPTLATDQSHVTVDALEASETSVSLHPLRSNQGPGDGAVSRASLTAANAEAIAAAIQCLHTPLI